MRDLGAVAKRGEGQVTWQNTRTSARQSTSRELCDCGRLRRPAGRNRTIDTTNYGIRKWQVRVFLLCTRHPKYAANHGAIAVQAWCARVGHDPDRCTEEYVAKFAEHLTEEEGLALSTCRTVITALGLHAKDLAIRGHGDAVPRPSQVQVVKSSMKVLGRAQQGELHTSGFLPNRVKRVVTLEGLNAALRLSLSRKHWAMPLRALMTYQVAAASRNDDARHILVPNLAVKAYPRSGPDAVGPDPAAALVFNSGLRKHQKPGRVVHSSVVRYAEVTRCPVSAAADAYVYDLSQPGRLCAHVLRKSHVLRAQNSSGDSRLSHSTLQPVVKDVMMAAGVPCELPVAPRGKNSTTHLLKRLGVTTARALGLPHEDTRRQAGHAHDTTEDFYTDHDRRQHHVPASGLRAAVAHQPSPGPCDSGASRCAAGAGRPGP